MRLSNIALVTGSYPPLACGVGDHAFQLVAHLNDEVDQVAIISSVTPERENTLPRVQVYKAGTGWGVKECLLAARLVRRLKPQVVIFPHPTLMPLKPLYPLLMLPMFKKVAPLILLLHEFSEKPWYYRIVTQVLARISDAVVCVNKYDHHLLARQGGLEDKLFYIPLGSNILPAPGYAWQPLTNNQGYLVYFGFIFKDKGIDYLVSAMEMLQDEFSYLKLYIIADLSRGDLCHIQALKDKIAALGLTGRIIFTDRLSSREVSRYMQNASCMVLPFTQGISDRRGSTECAMLHGVPLISTNGPKTLPNIIHGQHVWLVPPRDSAALANAIKMMIRDEDLQKRLSEGCASRSAHRNWRKIAKSFSGIMHHTLHMVQNRNSRSECPDIRAKKSAAGSKYYG